MSQFMTYDYWVDNFIPIVNTIAEDHGEDLIYFDTHGDEGEFVKTQPNENIWTEVDGDSGTYIIAGYHWVNRIQYYITNKPWTDEMTEVPTWVYRICDCSDNTEDGEYDPTCGECDEGTIDIDCDSVLALKDIYGEDAPIVG
jgi:hypothetical protein